VNGWEKVQRFSSWVEDADVGLRPYQNEAVAAVIRAWLEKTSTLLVMPTGTGKTLTFADIIWRMQPKRAMVLAHREELVFQAQRKIEQVTGLTVHVEMAGSHVNMRDLAGTPQVIVSTVQTHTAGGDGGGRMTKFNPHDFGVLIIDEAHHATASTYRRCIDWYRRNPDLKVLGVTATPDRADEAALGQVYESVAYDYEVLDAIDQGWLVPVEQQMVHVEGLDFSAVRSTADDDLNGGDLAEIMEFEKNLHGIADPSFRIACNRRTLVFAASVVQAERLAEILNRHREGCAAWICGKTDKDERRNVLRDFAAGKLQFVCNVGCLTEGFDDAGVELIVMGRPTKSRSLYAQMIGRATRPAEIIAHGLNDAASNAARRIMIAASCKPSCEVVDFVGNSGKHKLCTSADVLGGKVSDEAIAVAVQRVRDAGGPVDMAKALDQAQAEIDLARQIEAARRAAMVARAKFTATRVDPFDTFDIQPVRERGWDVGRKLSDKQMAQLMKNGIDPTEMPYGQAQQLLDEIFRRYDAKLASFKQTKLLKRNGFVAPMRRDEASKALDVIAERQGWAKKEG
jgi:superfamily II DNA or RNA helicase